MADFRVLEERDHILLRPGIMIGQTTNQEFTKFVCGQKKTVTYVPGLLKILNELIDNSIDEHIRSGEQFATKIDVKLSSLDFEVSDNGRGIPVVEHDGVLQPQLCWCAPRAGTSFAELDGEDRIGPGANGVGSFCANVFASSFLGITSDGKLRCRVECEDNATIKSVTTMKTSQRGTSVYMTPDLKRFGIDLMDETYQDMVRDRLIALSICYPKIAFTFNGMKIGFKKNHFKEYTELHFGSEFALWENDNVLIALGNSPEEEFFNHSVISGLMMTGGEHENFIMDGIVSELRPLIKKKFKVDVLPASIKRHFILLCAVRRMANIMVDSQTKERLTNGLEEIRQVFGCVDFGKLAKKIVETPSLIDPVVEAQLAKLLAAEKRAETLAAKKIGKIKVLKHVPAKNTNPTSRTLFLCEGDSPKGQGVKVRDVDKHGFYPMRGKVLNTHGVKNKTILENQVLKEIMNITGLTLDDQTCAGLEYGNICFLCDADEDGALISCLLTLFFSRWKKLFDDKRIHIVESPIIIATKGKDVKFFYSKDEYKAQEKKLSSYEIRYIKGLGSLRANEYREVIHNPRLITLEWQEPKALDIMFGSDYVEERKKILMGEELI